MSEFVSAVTDATFNEEVLQSDMPVLVDFWATWCGPCVQVAPVLEAIAEEHQGKIKIVKLNVDENMDTAMAYKITSIPALKVFQNGEVVHASVGAKPKQILEQELAAFLG